MKIKEDAINNIRHKRNSRRGKSSKRKGGNYERVIAKTLGKFFGIELKRTPQSGGFAKNDNRASGFRGDVTTIDDSCDFLLHVECKDCKTWSLPAWLKQAESDCPEGRFPVVVFHKHGTSEDYICLNLKNFLEIVSIEKVVKRRGKK